MKLCDTKKRCILDRAIEKTNFIQEIYENFKVFRQGFLQQMCTNLALSTNSLTSSEDILDGKVDGKICFLLNIGQ